MRDHGTPERVVLVGFGPVGARFAEELLPLVREGLVDLTIVGAERAAAYNRVLIAELAVGETERESLDLVDVDELTGHGVRVLTGSSVVTLNRSRHAVTLGDGSELGYDRLVLATGSRAQVPTLDGVARVRRDRLRPPVRADELDSAEAPLPPGVSVLRDLDDAARVRAAVDAGKRIVVLGAGVLGMEFALGAARTGAQVAVVYHGAVPMERNIDLGAGRVLAASARRAGVSLVARSRAEGLLLSSDDEGRFEALLCADGKQIDADLLVLSCGVAPRSELAALASLPVARGVLVDHQLRSWTDPDVYAIGDCAHVADPALGERQVTGGPSGLIGAGWRQADQLARRFATELRNTTAPEASTHEPVPVLMLKADGIDLVAAGDVTADPWDEELHTDDCADGRVVAQWADPGHGRYVKMVSRGGVLEGFVSVGMPRTGAELTLMFQSGSELPADRSLLLRFDGPDVQPAGASDAFAPAATVCWCNGVTVQRILDAADSGDDTVACIGSSTRAGTGCGGCKNRIGELLEHHAASRDGTPEVPV